MATALEARGLSKRYGELVALDSLDLTIDAGESVALIGPNGAGKTTLLQLAAGLLEPSAGDVVACGARPGSLEARARVAYVPDTPSLYDDLSLREHVEFIARLHGVAEWKRRGDELIDRLGLADRADDLPTHFSRGMRQKSSLVIGLVRPFELLLIDEPVVGLDPGGREALFGLLSEVRREGAAIVVSTHQAELLSRADRAIVLIDGQLADDGPPNSAMLAELALDEPT